jgi:predicted NUDIX family NTP pyrophosphohydrolase
MPVSAGLLLFRRSQGDLEVFLVHPGGPFFAHRDAGVWTIPKGLVKEGEDKLDAARREFSEETGFAVQGPFLDLGAIRQKAGKEVRAWAVEGDADPAQLRSNLCPIEWPPRSGKKQWFPEVDRGGWFSVAEARQKILEAQFPFIERLIELLNTSVF